MQDSCKLCNALRVRNTGSVKSYPMDDFAFRSSHWRGPRLDVLLAGADRAYTYYTQLVLLARPARLPVTHHSALRDPAAHAAEQATAQGGSQLLALHHE